MSKKVKKIQVKVTFKVGLGDLSIPEKALKELKELHKKSKELDSADVFYSNANEWLVSNIKHKDCFDCKFEIEQLS
jgi:hypothetical protein